MTAITTRAKALTSKKTISSRRDLNGYVARVAKQLAKSGRLADMLNGGEDLLRQIDPAAHEALIRIARAVRYALAQGSGNLMSKA